MFQLHKHFYRLKFIKFGIVFFMHVKQLIVHIFQEWNVTSFDIRVVPNSPATSLNSQTCTLELVCSLWVILIGHRVSMDVNDDQNATQYYQRSI